MSLKLAGLPDDTPVKMSIELAADVHRDLVLYAETLSGEGDRRYTPAQLIGPMLNRFMSTDRAFVAARTRRQTHP
jgi:hypothetical protein